MIFRTYGNNTLPSLMLIHGMANTAELCYGRIVPYLDQYHVILCELDGHSEQETGLFLSIADSCEKIERYVAQNLNGRLFGLLGFSLGGTIAVELMTRQRIRIEKAILDAAFCVKMGALAPIFTKAFCWAIGRIKTGKTIPAFLIESVMGKGNSGIVDTLWRGIDLRSVRNVCREVYGYEVGSGLTCYPGEVAFWHGSNEFYPPKTAALLQKSLPQMTVEAFAGMGHGQFLNEQPEEYAVRMKLSLC